MATSMYFELLKLLLVSRNIDYQFYLTGDKQIVLELEASEQSVIDIQNNFPVPDEIKQVFEITKLSCS